MQRRFTAEPKDTAPASLEFDDLKRTGRPRSTLIIYISLILRAMEYVYYRFPKTRSTIATLDIEL